MIFTAYHRFGLIAFAVTLVFAAIKVFKLRNTPATYNARLLPFAYYSLSSWIFWVLQYGLLLAGPYVSVTSVFFQSTGLLLGVVHNALWVSAVLSLYSKHFSRVPCTLPSLIAVASVTASLSYTTGILASEAFVEFEAVGVAVFFAIAVAYSIWQLGQSKLIAIAFVIHGLSQWLWRYLWFTPLPNSDFGVLAFPIFRILLLILWIRMISAILQRAEASHKEAVKDIEQLELDPLATCDVMISSTVRDLAPEREAAERAVHALHLTGFRAEAFGSLPHPPRKICALLAEHCDIFILIIGEHYGHVIESEGKSVVQFEYEVAYRQNPQKILVYVKDGVKREPPLEEFRERLEHFESGFFRSRFTTPEDLYEKIHKNLAQWLISQAKQNHGT